MHIKSIKKKGSEYLIILDDETLKVNEEEKNKILNILKDSLS